MIEIVIIEKAMEAMAGTIVESLKKETIEKSIKAIEQTVASWGGGKELVNKISRWIPLGENVADIRSAIVDLSASKGADCALNTLNLVEGVEKTNESVSDLVNDLWVAKPRISSNKKPSVKHPASQKRRKSTRRGRKPDAPPSMGQIKI